MSFQELIKSKWFLPVIVLAAATVLFVQIKYNGRFYPGVYIAGESVAGKTHDEVLQEFKAKADVLVKDGVDVVFERPGGKITINIPGSTSGLTSDTLVEYFSLRDLEGEIANAYNWGRKGSILRRAKQQSQLILGKNFNSAISVHDEAVRSLLSREVDVLEEPTPARFSFAGGKVVISPEKPGDNVDIEEIIDSVRERVNAFDVNPVVINVELNIPYTTEQRLKPFVGLVGQLAKSANVNFYYKSRKWQVSGKTLITWLTLKSNNFLTIDNNKLEEFLSKSVVPLINDPPQNSRFQMKDGRLTEIYPGKEGNVVNIEKTIETIETIIPHFERSYFRTGNISSSLVIDSSKINFNPKEDTIDVRIETMRVEPKITQKTIDQYRIKDLVGYARTNFAGGSLDRQHNIEMGVSRLTGILIAPGEQFSMVKALGPVTEKTGFVKEFVIKQDRTIKELGGGLCQLATTLFRTVLDAGLPVTERINHKYVIPYYGPGLDATIYGPHPDLRFINDTGHYLLLQGVARNNEAIFELYGVADGRVVEISKPILSDERPIPPTRHVIDMNLAPGETRCSTVPHKGITAHATYTVRYPDDTVKETVFKSVYEAWPIVCLMGPSTGIPPLTSAQDAEVL